MPIHTGSEGLVFIEDDIIPLVQVDEELTLDSVGGGAHINITTKSYDSKADSKRSSFMSQGLSSIKEGYQNYYANLYPNIKVEDVDFEDSTNQSQNFFTVREVYLAPEVWFEEEPDLGQVFEYQAMELQGMLDKSSNYQSDEPYSLGNRIEFIQTTTMNLPETWSLSEEQVKISNDYFDYSYSMSLDHSSKQRFQIKHRYYLKKEFIEPGDISDVLKDYGKAYDNTGYQLSYGLNNSTDVSSVWSWLIRVILSIVIFVIGLYLYKCLYYYNPPTDYHFPNKAIGGIMILPMIGLMIAPFIMGYNLISGVMVEEVGIDTAQSLWISDSVQNGKFLACWLIMDWIVVAGMLTYTVITIYLFLDRRSSVPRIMLGFYMLTISYTLASNLISVATGEAIAPNEFSQIVRDIVISAVWAIFFMKSERVKETFTRRLNQPTTPISPDSILE